MSSNVPYVKTGRTGQKGRTQAAMLEAARKLMDEGVTPTVENAAARAGVSRATAYRYFPNQRALLVSSHPIVNTPSLLPPNPPGDAVQRVRLVALAVLDSIVENETALRAQLRISLEPSGDRPELPLRQGRRIMWFEDALNPLRDELGRRSFRRLTLSLAAFVSLEVLVWLVDLAGLSRRQAADQIVWTTEQFVRSALAAARDDHGHR